MNPTAGSNSLTQRRGQADVFTQIEINNIRIIKGDDFCREKNINSINFMKIDTEGHEYSVLLGFSGMIESRAIDVIQFEYGGTWLDSKRYLSDIYNLFESSNYAICRLHPNGLELFSTYNQREDTFEYANYVALRRELLSRFNSIS